MPIEERMGALVARNQLDHTITRLTAEVDRDSSRWVDGRGACASWLRDECHMTGSAAYAQVRLARQLPKMPETAMAFSAGELSCQHASAISRTVERVVMYGGNGAEAES